MLRVFLALLVISLGLTACGGEPPKDIAKNPEVQKGRDALHAGDYQTALDILMPLAEQGEARAMNVIGYMYRRGYGFPQDDAEACNWYEKSAEAGDIRGQRNFGRCFRFGDGRHRDLLKAVTWYSASADQGNVNAMLSLMNLYNELGEDSRYVYWAAVAANQGSVAGKMGLFLTGETDKAPTATLEEWGCFVFQVLLFDRSRTLCDS